MMLCNRECFYAEFPDHNAYYLELSHSSQTIGQAVEQAALYAVQPHPPFVQPFKVCAIAALLCLTDVQHSSTAQNLLQLFVLCGSSSLVTS